ncbi:MAG: hypothetical protein Q8M40_02650 [Legionella sp.]|nr:hypothetical protein [Legionella sp.]HRD69352.1 hypothetical protein [Legionella sp.]
MKRIIMSILAVLLPWLVLLIHDNPGGAFVALIMQATVIGWPFASMWAWRLVNPVPNISHKK